MKEKLQRQALIVRVALFLLQVLTTYLIPPYDTSAAEAYPSSGLLLDGITSIGHGNWDSIYFNHLAQHGYDYENFGAFFPLYPAIIAGLASLLYLPLQLLMSYSSCVVLTSILLNNSLFYVNSLMLFKLSRLFGLSETKSYQAALLYTLNPASIFLSVGYTESLFSFFVILGLLIREADSQLYFLCFSLATGVRSNGLSLVFFILYDHILNMIKSGNFLIVNFVCMVIQTCISIAPFFYFQSHLYKLYCNNTTNANGKWAFFFGALMYNCIGIYILHVDIFLYI